LAENTVDTYHSHRLGAIVATLTLKPEPPKAQGTAERGKPVSQQQAERPVDGKNPRDISHTGMMLQLTFLGRTGTKVYG